MPLPAAWHALPHVGAPRTERPHPAACTDTPVGRLLRCCPPPHWHATHRFRAEIQRRLLPALPAATAQALSPRQTPGRDPGQRQVPSCSRSALLVAPAPQAHHTAVSPSVQPGAQSDRTCLEACASTGNPQPILRNTGRTRRGGARAIRDLGKTESTVDKTMRHYLRRHV